MNHYEKIVARKKTNDNIFYFYSTTFLIAISNVNENQLKKSLMREH